MKIKRVERAGHADVYNMEVEETHDFVIQGGVISHNCADSVRYICMANPMAPVEVQEKKAKVWSPLDDDEEIKRDQYAFYRKY